MQLVAYGAQDIYLTGNPQITFFKVVYRRHTNFSMEAIQQTFNGSFSNGGSNVTCTISRNGDLVSNLWLDVALPEVATGTAGTYTAWTNNTGHAFVKECELEIGGQRIDRHYSQWLDVWNELTDHDEKEWLGLNKHGAKNAYIKGSSAAIAAGTRLYVPFQFWFCRNIGLALPLIALQYHEVKLKLQTRDLLALVNGDATAAGDIGTSGLNVELWADYIYLDTDERRRFAQVSHEYLIEQLQREETIADSEVKSVTLNFNHPVKELIWVAPSTKAVAESQVPTDVPSVGVAADRVGSDYFNYTGPNTTGNTETIAGQSSVESFGAMKLQLNGHDRFSERNASYFRLCQPCQAGHKIPSKKIYVYSFALKPEEHQPSGTCNFSRIDNAKMVFSAASVKGGKGLSGPSAANLTVYAVNYNVLRIMSGMGGLAYSN